MAEQDENGDWNEQLPDLSRPGTDNTVVTHECVKADVQASKELSSHALTSALRLPEDGPEFSPFGEFTW